MIYDKQLSKESKIQHVGKLQIELVCEKAVEMVSRCKSIKKASDSAQYNGYLSKILRFVVHNNLLYHTTE